MPAPTTTEQLMTTNNTIIIESVDKLESLRSSADDSEEIQEIVALIICSLFLIIYILFFSKLLSLNKKKKEVRRTSIWMMVLPIVYVSIYTVRYWLELIQKQWYDDLYFETTLDVCFVIGNGVFYLIMIIRLKIGFERTQYKLSTFKLSMCMVFLLLSITINIVYYLIKRNGIHDPSLINNKNIQNWNTKEIDTTFFIFLVCNNLILAVILIYYFVKNIVLMIIKQRHNLSPTNQYKNSLSENQLKLASIAVRYALLCSIAIISTNIQFSLWILFAFHVFDNRPMTAIYFSIINEWLWDIVLIVNFTCILLTFSSNVYQSLCSLCHKCCEKSVEFFIVGYSEDNDSESAEYDSFHL